MEGYDEEVSISFSQERVAHSSEGRQSAREDSSIGTHN
jgi:hypothetical protein